jgi:hypothetical protein
MANWNSHLEFEYVCVDMVLGAQHNSSIIQSALFPLGAAPGRVMPNEDLIREIATKACREALQEKSQELVESVARRMGIALASQPLQREHTKELRDGAMLIAGSRTQTETLEALLAGCSAITSRCGLLILHGAHATGWSCHELTTLDNFKRATMDCSRGVAAAVINSCSATATQVSNLDPGFIARLGLESSAQILLVPVKLKERPAALLIALSKQSDDLAGLELLVQVAQLTLDLQAYRKASPQPAGEPSRTAVTYSPTESPKPAQGTQIPKAAYAAAISNAPTVPEPEPVYAVTAIAQPIYDTLIAAPGFHESGIAPQPISPVLDQAHEKARRFAKLLVEEIKLYNQTKVAEGRAQGDLYSRLRDDIEKSRAAYHKRCGESVRDVDYFTQELMRILAGNNRAVMGAGFPG